MASDYSIDDIDPFGPDCVYIPPWSLRETRQAVIRIALSQAGDPDNLLCKYYQDTDEEGTPRKMPPWLTPNLYRGGAYGATNLVDKGDTGYSRYGIENLRGYINDAVIQADKYFDWNDPSKENALEARKAFPTSWCGIFATWVWRRAGITSVKFKLWDGQTAGIGTIDESEGGARTWRKLPICQWHTGSICEGDIGYLDKGQHHFIIIAVDGNDLLTVDGNAKGSSIIVCRKHLRHDAVAYYRCLGSQLMAAS
jgi:hypothetical protein